MYIFTNDLCMQFCLCIRTCLCTSGIHIHKRHACLINVHRLYRYRNRNHTFYHTISILFTSLILHLLSMIPFFHSFQKNNQPFELEFKTTFNKFPSHLSKNSAAMSLGRQPFKARSSINPALPSNPTALATNGASKNFAKSDASKALRMVPS